MRQLVAASGQQRGQVHAAGRHGDVAPGRATRGRSRCRWRTPASGFPSTRWSKIFERFYQVDSSLVRRYGGTGLGLAICKSIVEWHGGRVFAESDAGTGLALHGGAAAAIGRRAWWCGRRRDPPSGDRGRAEAGDRDGGRGHERAGRVADGAEPNGRPGRPGGDRASTSAWCARRACRPGQRRGRAGWCASPRPVCVSEPRTTLPSARPRAARTTAAAPSCRCRSRASDGLLGVLNVTDPVGGRPFDAEDCHLLLAPRRARRRARGSRRVASSDRRRDVEGPTQRAAQVLQHLERGAAHRARPGAAGARAGARDAPAEAEVGLIGFAASVHDVGMTMVGERRAPRRGGRARPPRSASGCERHPELGAELLEPLEAMGAVREIVLSHHEWWDGCGYPRGLAGDEIPIGARILAVVDAYESMTVGRAHRPARIARGGAGASCDGSRAGSSIPRWSTRSSARCAEVGDSQQRRTVRGESRDVAAADDKEVMAMAKGKILVVDDEIYIVHILDFSLGMEGYEVLTALDGEQALEKARAEQPDLIVLDIMMPKLDGYETCKMLKADDGHQEHPGHPAVGEGPQRGPEDRLRSRRGRLHHQAVQPAQAGRAHQRASSARAQLAAHAGLDPRTSRRFAGLPRPAAAAPRARSAPSVLLAARRPGRRDLWRRARRYAPQSDPRSPQTVRHP